MANDKEFSDNGMPLDDLDAERYGSLPSVPRPPLRPMLVGTFEFPPATEADKRLAQKVLQNELDRNHADRMAKKAMSIMAENLSKVANAANPAQQERPKGRPPGTDPQKTPGRA